MRYLASLFLVLILLNTACGAAPTLAPDEPFVDSGQRLGSARSRDVALGDIDGDGDLDAFLANGPLGEIGSAVWLNDGQGLFTRLDQELGYGMGLDLGDLDGDGDLDVLIVGWYEPGEVWLNDGTGIFLDSNQRLGDAGGWDVVLGDIDNDGDLDAFIAHESANSVWLNDGQGIFVDSEQRLGASYSAGAGLADLDGDGDLDAVAVGWGEPGLVWLNDGAGAFEESGQTLTPGHIHIHGMTLGDVTGDGAVDVIMAGASNEVWFNDGAGAFTNSDQGLAYMPCDSVALGDLDLDGDLDAYMAVGFAGSAIDEIWLNDGSGHFVNSEMSLSHGFSSGIGLGDFDGDGDLDAFIAHGQLGMDSGGGMPNEVWLNQMP